MKKIVIILFFVIFLFNRSFAGSFFGNLINTITKKPAANTNESVNTSQTTTQATAQTPPTQQENYSCQAMLENSPKRRIITGMATSSFVGAAVGAAAGAALSKNDRAAGAMVGGIAGLAGGALASAIAHHNELVQPYDVIANRINYNPNSGPYFKIVDVIQKSNVYKVGQYIYLDVRYDVLTPQKDQAQLLKYYATLYRNNKPIMSFTDSIYLPEGEASDLFYIPVCDGAIPGNYYIELKAVCNGITQDKTINFKIS